MHLLHVCFLLFVLSPFLPSFRYLDVRGQFFLFLFLSLSFLFISVVIFLSLVRLRLVRSDVPVFLSSESRSSSFLFSSLVQSSIIIFPYIPVRLSIDARLALHFLSLLVVVRESFTSPHPCATLLPFPFALFVLRYSNVSPEFPRGSVRIFCDQTPPLPSSGSLHHGRSLNMAKIREPEDENTRR